MASFDAPPSEREGEGKIVMRATYRFQGAAAFAFEAAHGREFFDQGSGFRERLFDGEFAEVKGKLQATDQVLLGDAPEAVDKVVAIAGADDDGREAPPGGRVAEGAGGANEVENFLITVERFAGPVLGDLGE